MHRSLSLFVDLGCGPPIAVFTVSTGGKRIAHAPLEKLPLDERTTILFLPVSASPPRPGGLAYVGLFTLC